MPGLHLLIKGKVQGVFYRARAKEKAEELGITGWVKNMAAGEVEVYAVGRSEDLESFVNWCWHGPKNAEVTEIVVTPGAEEYHAKFHILR